MNDEAMAMQILAAYAAQAVQDLENHMMSETVHCWESMVEDYVAQAKKIVDIYILPSAGMADHHVLVLGNDLRNLTTYANMKHVPIVQMAITQAYAKFYDNCLVATKTPAILSSPDDGIRAWSSFDYDDEDDEDFWTDDDDEDWDSW